jgi:quercetin dioxygenase-like cupin family protein
VDSDGVGVRRVPLNGDGTAATAGGGVDRLHQLDAAAAVGAVQVRPQRLDRRARHQGQSGASCAPTSRARPTELRDALAATAVLKLGQQTHPPHQHAEEEFLVVTEGSGEWHLAAKDFPAAKGDAIYAEPWVVHGIRDSGTTPLTTRRALPSHPHPETSKSRPSRLDGTATQRCAGASRPPYPAAARTQRPAEYGFFLTCTVNWATNELSCFPRNLPVI